MTDEDDFQRAIDTRPDDWQTRLVLADWLDEHDDPRGPGYRALGLWRRCPEFRPRDPHPYWSYTWARWSGWLKPDYQKWAMCMPWEWWDLLRQDTSYNLGHFATRRLAEGAAALAFSRLPQSRRLELLSAPAAESR